MAAPTEVWQLTNDAVGFTPDDLRASLDQGVAVDSDFIDVPHKPDLLVERYPIEELGNVDSPDEVRTCNIDTAGRYIDDLELEYARLEEVGIAVMPHTTLLIPKDPSYDGGGVLYIASATLPTEETLYPFDIEDTDPRYSAAIYAGRALLEYLSTPSHTKWSVEAAWGLPSYIAAPRVTLTRLAPDLYSRQAHAHAALRLLHAGLSILPSSEDLSKLMTKANLHIEQYVN